MHLKTINPGRSSFELYRIGQVSCMREGGQSWRCQNELAESLSAFDLSYLESATAFRLGRREMLNGEMNQVLLFNNPSQANAWLAWWVGEETGYIHRQVMVAPGHLMITNYLDHNLPLGLTLPAEARR